MAGNKNKKGTKTTIFWQGYGTIGTVMYNC